MNINYYNNNLLSEPLVSVRILAYNHEKYIAQCIDSIISQKTDFAFEVIIGEDASTDRTREICRKYKRRFPNIINLIENERNLGIFENSQKTIGQYRGKYVAWCDGDDYWTDDGKLQKQVDILESREDIAICFHKVKIINEVNKEQIRYSNEDTPTITTIYELARGNYIYSASVMFRHGLFEYPKFMKNMPLGDYIVHIFNASKGNIYFIEEPMATYRIHSGGVWEHQSQNERNKKLLKVFDALIGQFNPEIDKILNDGKSDLYFQLSHDAVADGNINLVKQYFTNGARSAMKGLADETSLTLLNRHIAGLRNYVDRSKDTEQLILFGELANMKRMYSDAILFLDDALKTEPNNNIANLQLSISYQELNQFEKALIHLEKYLRDMPNDAIELNRFALMLSTFEGKIPPCLKILEKAHRISPNNTDILKNLVLLNWKQKELEKTNHYISKYLKLVDYDIEILQILNNLQKANTSRNIETAIEPDEIPNYASVTDEDKQSIAFEEKVVEQKIANNNKSNDNDRIIASIVIPVFNRLELTKNCIESIYRVGSKYNFEVIVIDNASSDETLEYLKGEYNLRNNFRFHRNHTNLGFAKGCNLGIRFSEGKYIILLNNDIIVLENWLDGLVEAADADDRIAIAGSLLLYPDGERIQHCGVRIGYVDGALASFHIHKLRKLKYVQSALQSIEMNAVTGACMLLRASLLPVVGVFDEIFINSYEDMDLCLRARSMGYKVYYCADSRVLHYESESPNRHDHDNNNFALFNIKWKDIFKGDISEDEFTMHNNLVWFLEYLSDYPESTEYLFKAYNMLNSIGSFEEALEYKKMIKETINSSNNVILFYGTISFIILVRDNIEYTRNCIESIFATCQNIDFEIILVDNASSKETANYLDKLVSEHQNIVGFRNKENKSYSKANNQGARFARNKYLIFLNNDTILFDGAIESIISVFEEEKSIGIQGAKLLYPNDTIQHCGIVWGQVTDHLDLHYHIYLTLPKDTSCVNHSREYQFVTGALLAIRHELFLEINGFDENYIFGHEDLDLCLKVRNIGKKVWYNHNCQAYHYESITKKSEGIEKFERFITQPDSFDARNHKYFLEKWKDTIISDANDYFIKDGMLGFVSITEIRKDFISRLHSLSSGITKLRNEQQFEQFERVMKVLFGKDLLKSKDGTFNLGLISEDKLKSAEIMLEANNDTPFDIFDIFDNKSTSDDTNIDKSIISAIKPKQILMTMYGWNESGGGTTFPKSVAKQLAALGNEVVVLYATCEHPTNRTPYYLEYTFEDNVHLYGVYNRPSIFLDIDKPEREINDERIVTYFNQLLNEFKPDIVHFHNFLGLSFEIARQAKQRGLTTIYTPYNYHLLDPTLYLYRSDLSLWRSTDFFENSELPKRNPHLIEQYKKRISAAKELLNVDIDYTFAVSRRVKELISDFASNSDKIAVIHQVHQTISKLLENTPMKRSPQLPIKFGFIGGVMPHKGAHIIVQAAQLLPPNKAEFHIYGFISEKYAQILKSLDRNNNVQLHGEYSSNELANITNNLDAMLLPSLWEDCAPFVITESLAMKLPVICSNIGGFPDFIKDRFNGRLYSHNSPTELASILIELINNPQLITNMQNNCNVTITFDDHIKHILNVYDLLIKGKRPNINDIELFF